MINPLRIIHERFRIIWNDYDDQWFGIFDSCMDITSWNGRLFDDSTFIDCWVINCYWIRIEIAKEDREMLKNFDIAKYYPLILQGVLQITLYTCVIWLMWNNVISPKLDIPTINILEALGLRALTIALIVQAERRGENNASD